MEVRMKVHVFFGDSLNKNIPRKKQLGYLMKRAYTLSCSEKQVLLKRIKAVVSCQEVFPKIGVPKIQASHNGSYKIQTESLRIL